MASRSPSLLVRLQRLIECSYDWRTGIEDLGPFLVGDEGYRRLYQGQEIVEELPGLSPGPRTLVTSVGHRIRLGIYYPDEMIRRLEERNPLHHIDDENVEPFSILVEELDHCLMLAWCACHHREVRLVELEFHAYITKYLVLAHFLARHSRRPHLTSAQRHWVLARLFSGAGEDLPEPFAHRYSTAAKFALRFIGSLASMPSAERVRSLRRFGRKPWSLQRCWLESPGGGEVLGLLLAV